LSKYWFGIRGRAERSAHLLCGLLCPPALKKKIY